MPMIRSGHGAGVVGVTREGHVTGMILDVPVEPAVGKVIYSDSEAFR
jgi:hypothetical protein